MKSAYRILIKRWAVLALVVLLSLFNTGCNGGKKSVRNERAGTKSNAKTASTKKAKNNKKAKKPLLTIKEVNPDSGQFNYIFITICPEKPATSLENYFITAEVLNGQGRLLGAKEKVKNRFQYKVPLGDEGLNLNNLLATSGNADKFQNSGKWIRFKCKYEPPVGAKQGDEHQLVITVIQKSEQGEIMQQERAEINLTIKRDIHKQPKG